MALFDSGPNIQNNNTYDPYGYHGIKPAVIDEIKELSALKFDIDAIQVNDPHGLDLFRQALLDDVVFQAEDNPETGYDLIRSFPTINTWTQLLERAIALHVLYHPDGSTLASNIDQDAYELPLFDGMSAEDKIRELLPPKKADKIIADYRSYLSASLDGGDELSIGPRDFFKGVSDAKAIRTRAEAAGNLIMTHFDLQHQINSHGLVSASLGCGAASPIFELVKTLDKHNGTKFETIHLVDQDPMALATAVSLSKHEEVKDKVNYHLENLIAKPITSYIEPNSVDVVDLLGLFEYLPDRVGVGLLELVKKIVKSDGVIIFGNMLKDRPQQIFFEKVVKWRRLYQRSFKDVFSMITKAGLNVDSVKTRVPQEGVYAIYSCSVE